MGQSLQEKGNANSELQIVIRPLGIISATGEDMIIDLIPEIGGSTHPEFRANAEAESQIWFGMLPGYAQTYNSIRRNIAKPPRMA